MFHNENIKFDVKINDKFGRYTVAKDDLKRGELILLENPIFLCPNWDSSISCFNCFDDFKKFCVECNVIPLCNQCNSHNQIECDYFKNLIIDKKILQNNLNYILPIRCLLLSIDNKTKFKYERLMEMESHLNLRRDSERWIDLDQQIIQPLIKMNFLNQFPFKIDEEILQKICGIFDINSFHVRSPKDFKGLPSGEVNLRGIYPNAALMPHNCIANTLITVDKKYEMKIYASVDIKKGEIIFTNYTNPLFNTADRQLFLREGKYFECDCTRCIDPTELETNFSSIKCTSCEHGYLLPIYNGTKCNEFKCRKCEKLLSVDKVSILLDEIKTKIEEIGDDLRQLEGLNMKYSKILHPNHSQIIEIKQLIAAILRDLCINIPKPLPVALLNRKIDLCKSILPILRIFQPGLSRITGIALYETYLPIVQLAKQEFEMKHIDSKEFLKKLEEGENLLQESIEMLILESSDVPEGILARRGMIELKELKDAINRVKSSIEN